MHNNVDNTPTSFPMSTISLMYNTMNTTTFPHTGSSGFWSKLKDFMFHDLDTCLTSVQTTFNCICLFVYLLLCFGDANCWVLSGCLVVQCLMQLVLQVQMVVCTQICTYSPEQTLLPPVLKLLTFGVWELRHNFPSITKLNYTMYMTYFFSLVASVARQSWLHQNFCLLNNVPFITCYLSPAFEDFIL